jgi:hypothetical protein
VDHCGPLVGDAKQLWPSRCAGVIEHSKYGRRLQQRRHLRVVLNRCLKLFPARAGDNPNTVLARTIDHSVAIMGVHAPAIVNDPDAQREGQRVLLQRLDETFAVALRLELFDFILA